MESRSGRFKSLAIFISTVKLTKVIQFSGDGESNQKDNSH